MWTKYPKIFSAFAWFDFLFKFPCLFFYSLMKYKDENCHHTASFLSSFRVGKQGRNNDIFLLLMSSRNIYPSCNFIWTSILIRTKSRKYRIYDPFRQGFSDKHNVTQFAYITQFSNQSTLLIIPNALNQYLVTWILVKTARQGEMKIT